jgi:glycosyltransferase involved in cell wall biosynthesis
MKENKFILIISANFPPEPVVAASLSEELAEALSADRKVRVLTPEPSRPLGFTFMNSICREKSYEHIVVDSFTCPRSTIVGRMAESFSFGRHASRHIKRYRDSIQCCYVAAWPLLAQYLIIRTLKKYSIPSVVHIQDIYPESLSNRIPLLGNFVKKILLPFDTYVLKNSTKVIAISKNMRNNFIQTRGIEGDKIEIIENWKDEEEFLFRKKSGESDLKNKIKPGSFVFMYLGNIGPVAGVDLLIRSFAKADIKDSALVIAGCGPAKNECIRLAETISCSGIKFWEVPSGEMPAVQEIADVMLLPVKSGAGMSSVPSKLLAYMFSAKPVIACVDENSDTAYAIKESGCGWVLPPENTGILAETMKKVASHQNGNLKTYGENGLRYATQFYSSKRNLPKLVSAIARAEACL